MPSGDAAYAKASIAEGSKSFAAASRLLPADLRDDVARLYAWCRHADDVIDGQVLGHAETVVEDPAACLASLIAQTDAALAGTRTGDPVFDGFGDVAHRRGIAPALAHDHLSGFAMDVDGTTYATLDDLTAYCYGVAGSVGVMMALTIGVSPHDEDTLDRACDLGLAFQMTNIARDVAADARIGRVYLPQDMLRTKGLDGSAASIIDPANAEAVFQVVTALLDQADVYYRSAEVGVRRLPFRVAWAIASARSVYRAIGARRRAAGAAGLGARVTTSAVHKARLVAVSLPLRPARKGAPLVETPRGPLWQRPRHNFAA